MESVFDHCVPGTECNNSIKSNNNHTLVTNLFSNLGYIVELNNNSIPRRFYTWMSLLFLQSRFCCHDMCVSVNVWYLLIKSLCYLWSDTFTQKGLLSTSWSFSMQRATEALVSCLLYLLFINVNKKNCFSL